MTSIHVSADKVWLVDWQSGFTAAVNNGAIEMHK